MLLPQPPSLGLDSLTAWGSVAASSSGLASSERSAVLKALQQLNRVFGFFAQRTLHDGIELDGHGAFGTVQARSWLLTNSHEERR